MALAAICFVMVGALITPNTPYTDYRIFGRMFLFFFGGVYCTITAFGHYEGA